MKNKSLIVGLTVIVSLLSIYFLSFSLVSQSVQEDAATYATDKSGKVDFAKSQNYLDSIWFKPVFNFLGIEYTYKEIKEQELQLGLDLQGGMHVVLEVSPVEIIKVMAGSKAMDPSFKETLKRAELAQKNSQEKFINLFYEAFKEVNPSKNLSAYFTNSLTRGRINFDSPDAKVISIIDGEINDAIDRSFNVLRSRIDQFGVIQPNIQKLQGTGRIQLELPGIDNPKRARKLLQSAAVLEFWNVVKNSEFEPFVVQTEKYLAAQAKLKTGKTEDTDTSLAKGDSAKSNSLESKLSKKSTDTTKLAKKDSTKSALEGYFYPYYNSLLVKLKDTAKVAALIAQPEIQKFVPSNVTFSWASKTMPGKDNEELVLLYLLKKGANGKPILSGEDVRDSRIDNDPADGWGVSLNLNTDAVRKWRMATASAAQDKRAIAIVLDNAVYSAPNVNGEIPNGSCRISGGFQVEEAKDLANILKSGRMPAPTRIVEEAIVGPSLGQEAINQGLLSMVIALGLVVLFMFAYYSGGGMIANIALLFNVLFVVGILVQFHSVLTLPGIAGIVLTVGMAVDANVLIFERIREELREGTSLVRAVELGYEKAFSSIFDSNVTTLLSAVILFFLGSGPIKGFAITLIIGIFCSFFTAVYISRVILVWFVTKKNPTTIGFHTVFSKNLFQNLNFDYIGKRKAAYAFSISLLVLGAISIVAQGGLNLGVDFKGGRSYIVQFAEPVEASDVKVNLADVFAQTGTEVKTFGSSSKVKVTTSYLIDDESAEGDKKVEDALSTGLSKYKNSKFEILSSSKVGPTIADDIKTSSYYSLFLSLVGIFIYVAFRFKNRSFGWGGVIALLHDALMVVACFSIARWFGLSYEIDQVFVAAILTIVGYSINDTVVTFDRVREFSELNPEMAENNKAKVLNDSINHTMSRTIMTAMTVFMVVAILFVFGGEILRSFSFAMLIGVVFGSYSSIFIAVPIVLDLSKKSLADPIKPVIIEEGVA
jgi:SecD/SecF fusion protein